MPDGKAIPRGGLPGHAAKVSARPRNAAPFSSGNRFLNQGFAIFHCVPFLLRKGGAAHADPLFFSVVEGYTNEATSISERLPTPVKLDHKVNRAVTGIVDRHKQVAAHIAHEHIWSEAFAAVRKAAKSASRLLRVVESARHRLAPFRGKSILSPAAFMKSRI